MNRLLTVLFKAAVLVTLLTFAHGVFNSDDFGKGGKGKGGKGSKGKNGKAKGKNGKGNRNVCPTFGDPNQFCRRRERCSCECVPKPSTCPAAECIWTSADDTGMTAAAQCGAVLVAMQDISEPRINDEVFMGTDFSACPLSSTSALDYSVGSQWQATFTTPVDAVLLYAGGWRGAGGPSSITTIDYTFSQAFTIESGFDSGAVSGNTLSLPRTGFHDGILRFEGSPTISSLSVLTNLDPLLAMSAQDLTFAIP